MKNGRPAFSLIELLVVISIIVMLIAMLLPSLRNAKEVSKSLVCKSNQRQLFFGHRSYSQNSAGKFPHWNNWLWAGAKSGLPSAEWVEYGTLWPYIKNREVVVMNLVRRVQGLIVPKGNPKDISALADIGREDVRFINRQRGSGTRVLLDYKLTEFGLPSGDITGYDREEYTHLARRQSRS